MSKDKTRRRMWLLSNTAHSLTMRYALIPLRLMVGIIFLTHGLQKAFGWFGGPGFSGTTDMLANMGFAVPGLFAVLLILAEAVGGIMLILALAPRLAAAALIVVMAVALATAHKDESFFQTHVQQMVIAACVTMFFAGGGDLGLQRSRPRD
ncbi:MAG: DoxX family protein [Candidatus Brocadiia bacterium]